MAVKINLAFYATTAGGEPVRDWLKDLPKKHRHTIGYDLTKAQFAWPVGMPLCRALGEGLYEIRTTLSDDTESRVFICQVEEELVALHGCIKKTRKADPDNIALARKRMKELNQEALRRKKEKKSGKK